MKVKIELNLDIEQFGKIFVHMPTINELGTRYSTNSKSIEEILTEYSKEM
jgi:hypothetical protein